MKNISASVVQRFMSAEEYAEFINKYKQNKRFFSSNRRERLIQPLTTDENDLLVFYMTKTDQSISLIAKEKGMGITKAYHTIDLAAKKLIFQNKEKLGLI